jgi:hypothetical protein
MNHQCPVCGFPKLTESPRGKNGGGSFEICPSCGFQFGVTDDDQGISYDQWRTEWKKNGMKWSSHQAHPVNWNASTQLAGLAIKDSASGTETKRKKARSKTK